MNKRKERDEKYKETHKEYYKKYNEAHKKYHKEYSKKYREAHRGLPTKYRKEKREKLFTILGKKCVMCGNTDERVLEFDHISPRNKVRRRTGAALFNEYLKEISNLRVLCANCHRIITSREREERKILPGNKRGLIKVENPEEEKEGLKAKHEWQRVLL